MSATHNQLLIQAQRNIDLGFLQLENGDHQGAKHNLSLARQLIFNTRTIRTAQPEVAAASRENTGSCSACS